MSNIPTQQRAVDPFASYNSNVVNQLTRMNTYRGQESNGLIAIHPDLQITLDSTAPLYIVDVSPGIAYKDDMFLRLSAIHEVDFRDSTNYVDFGTGFDEIGYYYIVLQYHYAKSRPAPQVSIKIIKPSQRSNFDWSDPSTNDFIFLKAVNVINYMAAQAIDQDPDTNLFNADPDDATAKRRYVREYAGGEVTLPIFDPSKDVSRVVYDADADKFWFGYRDKWDEIGSGGSIGTFDTSGVAVGQLCYINSSGVATPSISTNLSTGADFVVKSVATDGKGLTSGIAFDVPIETAVAIAVGNLVYLSALTAGAITNIRPDGAFQVVGRALTAGDDANPINIIFSPKVMLTVGVEGTAMSWTGPDGSGLYYNDINISTLDTSFGVHASFFDNNDRTQITPSNVQIVSGGTILRVFLPINTLSVDYLISSQASYAFGGGSGVTLNHHSLINLDYASAGHTGFAPGPHDETFHSNPSIPSGAIVLFESDVAIAGYTLLTTSDDDVVYITKSSGAGGEAAGGVKVGGTWTQPTHQHTGPNHQHDLSNHAHTYSGTTSFVAASVAAGGANATAGHSHTYSGTTDPPNINLTGFSGTGLTGLSATINSWRPKGRNFTRQQRI